MEEPGVRNLGDFPFAAGMLLHELLHIANYEKCKYRGQQSLPPEVRWANFCITSRRHALHRIERPATGGRRIVAKTVQCSDDQDASPRAGASRHEAAALHH